MKKLLSSILVFAIALSAMATGMMSISADEIAPRSEEDLPKTRKSFKENPIVEKASKLINKGKNK